MNAFVDAFPYPTFMLYALLAGLGVTMMTGPLGSFVIWRRMSYFGDTLAHASLMGVALSLFLEIHTGIAVALVCVLLALGLVSLQRQRFLAEDTLLGILAHSTLAAGLVTISFIRDVRIDLMSFLFGDLLAVTPEDLKWIFATAILVLSLLYWLWKPLLAVTVHEALAQVEGYPVGWLRLALMLMLASVIAIAMKIVGILLITSLMIIPAATARRFARHPATMAILASLLGFIAVVIGLKLSYQWDTPAGPSVVLSSAALFAISLAFSKR
jgi:zinc transport system permease protein